jgi:hypothetical protein
MEKGSAGLVSEKEGGSTRRKEEAEARRLEMACRRLFFGEPRLQLMGVDFAVLGAETDERGLRAEGSEGAGEATNECFAGLVNTSASVRDFLEGEVNTGSTFSASLSSKMSRSASRWRLPLEGVAVGFMGVEQAGARAEIAFSGSMARLAA